MQETNLLVVTFHGFRSGEEGYKRCFPVVLTMPATQYKDFFFEMLNADKKGIVKLCLYYMCLTMLETMKIWQRT